jgi:hypothetical protein
VSTAVLTHHLHHISDAQLGVQAAPQPEGVHVPEPRCQVRLQVRAYSVHSSADALGSDPDLSYLSGAVLISSRSCHQQVHNWSYALADAASHHTYSAKTAQAGFSRCHTASCKMSCPGRTV